MQYRSSIDLISAAIKNPTGKVREPPVVRQATTKAYKKTNADNIISLPGIFPQTKSGDKA